MSNVFIYGILFQLNLQVIFSENKTNPRTFASIEDCLKSSNFPTMRKNFSAENHYEPMYSKWLPYVFPRCWFVLKEIVCGALFKESNSTIKSNLNVCTVFESECHMLDRKELNLKCDTPYYQIKNMSFEKYEYCSTFLQRTENKRSWLVKWKEKPLPGARKQKQPIGCTLSCDSSIKHYRPDQKSVYIPIIVQSIVAVLSVLFTMMTFLIDWRNQKRYPAVILFILSFLYFTCLCGWLIQFFGMSRKIVCNSSNQIRYSEPKSLESYACVLSFVLIYFSMVAITSWYMILMYSWDVSFKGLGSTKDGVREKVKFFHLAGWTPSLIFTIIIFFLEEVESNHITGICFTGYSSYTIRIIFVVTPIFSSLFFGTILLISAVRHLHKLKSSSTGNIIQKAMRNLTRTIYRLCLYGLVILVTSLLPTILFMVEDTWEIYRSDAYYSYVMCKIKSQYNSVVSCEPPKSSNFPFLHVQFSCLCVSAIVTSSWTWTKATLKIWMKFFRRKFCRKRSTRNENVQWFQRMNKKKIRPFIPPLDPNDPLNSSFPGHQLKHDNSHVVSRRNSLQDFIVDFNVRFRRKSSLDFRPRRSSDDIRSVMELFSARRGTNISIESIYSVGSLFQPHKKQRRSKSLNSLQNFGHLTTANFRKFSEGSISNLMVRPLESCQTNMDFYDRVYTPISRAHKSNIVADCIPYDIQNETQKVRKAKTAPAP